MSFRCYFYSVVLFCLFYANVWHQHIVRWFMTAHYLYVVLVVMEVITFIYCRLFRLGVTHKHTGPANVLQFTEREACITTSFIDFVMSQRVFFITRVCVCLWERESMHASLIRKQQSSSWVCHGTEELKWCNKIMKLEANISCRLPHCPLSLRTKSTKLLSFMTVVNSV